MPDREPLGILDVAALAVADCTPQTRISGAAVRYAHGCGPGWTEPGAALASDRLVIHAAGGRVVYRIGAYHPDEDVYEAEWPD